MVPIKHILNEDGVKEVFKIIVPAGINSGTYEIEKPDGWDDVDSVVNIDEELFFVKDFIIGDKEKLKFMEYGHEKAYKILKSVYQEQGGDGLIHFKYIGEKDGIQYDLLKDNFDVDLSTYSESFEKSMGKIENEIKKSEAQNKLFTREETTIDLFAEKDLDENVISPVESFEIGYKMGDKSLSNFYFYNTNQRTFGNNASSIKFFAFTRSSDYSFGSNTNNIAGIENTSSNPFQINHGPFVSTNISLKLMKVEISNFEVNCRTSGGNIYPNVRLFAVITGGTTPRSIELKTYEENLAGGIHYSRIRIDYQSSDIGNMEPGQSLHFEVRDIAGGDFQMFGLRDNTSIEIKTNIENPLTRVKTIRLIDALKQVVKSCTASSLNVSSNFLSADGVYYNTSISTGLYLRGLPTFYLNNKINTSFKNLFQDGISKILAAGFDIVNDTVVFEDLEYFFKDLMIYDLSEKEYLMDDYKIENDSGVTFNTLLFGSKKISTKSKDDIKNFVTASESITPITSVKSKFDKQTDLIIDEYKIKDLIEDKSSSTNESDDDLAMIDLVDVKDYWDEGVFEKCEHSNQGGKLILNCLTMPFDTTLIEVSTFVEIKEGLNVGIWLVEEVNSSKLKLSSGLAIQSGVNDTPIRYRVFTLTKNRTKEGFTNILNVRNIETATNMRHNPKYHMARWFSFFGSGLRKKSNTESIKVTNYKNNSEATMKINSNELANEFPDLITVGDDQTLESLRNYKQTFFNGNKITISYINITFEEFIFIYENWRYGLDSNRLYSRGYLRLNTPDGIFDVFPFGDAAFSHNKRNNTLTIKGKIKGKSVSNPELLIVEQLTKDTVKLAWDYSDDFINPTILIQYSTDELNWNTVEEIQNEKNTTITSSLFSNIFTGTVVYFRIIISTSDYYNKTSNIKQISWQFNDWIYHEISRTIDANCGTSYLTFELIGTGDFEIDWNFISFPGGGSAKVVDNENNIVIDIATPYGTDYDNTVTTSHTITNSSILFALQMKPTDNDGERYLNCNFGENFIFVNAEMYINIQNHILNDGVNAEIEVQAIKRYQQPGGPFEPSDPF